METGVRSGRACECGCGRTLDGMRPEARYATDACRTRHWKAKRMDPRDRKRKRDRERIARRRQHGPVASDARISYEVARGALLQRLWHFPGAEELVEEALREALPERLKDRPWTTSS